MWTREGLIKMSLLLVPSLAVLLFVTIFFTIIIRRRGKWRTHQRHLDEAYNKGPMAVIEIDAPLGMEPPPPPLKHPAVEVV